VYESGEEFLKLLKTQRGIDEIIKLHEVFLLKILKNCLVCNKSFQKVLLDIFKLTLKFADMWNSGIACYTSSAMPKIVELEKNINVYFDFIYRILSSILNRNQSTHLQPLIASLL